MIITERIRNYDWSDVEIIKKLAINCCQNKWRKGKIIDVKADKTFRVENIDKKTGEIIYDIIDIDEESAFCEQAKKIPDMTDKCDVCLLPEIICCVAGKGGLCGKIRELFKEFEANRRLIKYLIKFLRECYKELSRKGIFSIKTEELIDDIIYSSKTSEELIKEITIKLNFILVQSLF